MSGCAAALLCGSSWLVAMVFVLRAGGAGFSREVNDVRWAGAVNEAKITAKKCKNLNSSVEMLQRNWYKNRIQGSTLSPPPLFQPAERALFLPASPPTHQL
jgi:hypothetical protein